MQSVYPNSQNSQSYQNTPRSPHFLYRSTPRYSLPPQHPYYYSIIFPYFYRPPFYSYSPYDHPCPYFSFYLYRTQPVPLYTPYLATLLIPQHPYLIPYPLPYPQDHPRMPYPITLGQPDHPESPLGHPSNQPSTGIYNSWARGTIVKDPMLTSRYLYKGGTSSGVFLSPRLVATLSSSSCHARPLPLALPFPLFLLVCGSGNGD